MSIQALATEVPSPATRADEEPLRVAFLGPRILLDGCCPTASTGGLDPQGFATDGPDGIERAVSAAQESRASVTVVLDPARLPSETLNELPGATLGVLSSSAPQRTPASIGGALDRLLSFHPSATGARVGATEIWRAIPPPVADELFAPVRRPHGKLRAISVGRSTPHRERMLMPAKHHHDLLEVLHGVSGPALGELLGEYDVGVYVSPEPGGAFGQQIGMHLAAGQLLLAEAPTPAHGLERNIDYLHVDSPEGLAWVLDRLDRFPEMHHRIRVRGRMKAEQYRASRVFARIAHDLLADLAAFGSPREHRG